MRAYSTPRTAGRLLLIAACVAMVQTEKKGGNETLPVTHRPGALVIQGPKVSLAQGQYRILIDLPTHHYEEEIKAMGQFQIKSIEAVAKIRKMYHRLGASDATGSRGRQLLTLLFSDLTKRLTHALTEFRTDQEVLQSLQNLPVERESVTEKTVTLDTASRNRTKRDLAEYVGLASTGDLAELNNWVTQIQNSETKLAHSAEQQLSYLNRTMRRVNAQEDRINQLAILELRWENALTTLERKNSSIPEYIELILTYLQGTSVVNYYHEEIRHQLSMDIQRLEIILSGQLPPGLINMHEYRQILREAPLPDNTEFSFSESIETLVADLHQRPVKLIRDVRNEHLWAELTVPIYEHAQTYQLYQISPVPKHHPELTGVQEIIDLTDTYLAVSRNQHFTLDPNTNLYECGGANSPVQDPFSKVHLCVAPQAIFTYQKQSPLMSCAAAIYYEREDPLPPPCTTRVQLSPVTPVRHLRNNLWLYQPNLSEILQFACPNTRPPPIELHPDGGQIIMPPGCRGILGQVQIPARTNAEFHFYLPDQTHLTMPQYNGSFWISNLSLPKPTDNGQLIQKIKYALAHSTHMSMPLDKFKQTLTGITTEIDQNAITHFMKHNRKAPHAGTLVTVLVLAVLVGSLYCMGKCCWRKYTRRRQSRAEPQMIPMVTFAPTPALPRIQDVTARTDYRDESPPQVSETSARAGQRSRSQSRRHRSSGPRVTS